MTERSCGAVIFHGKKYLLLKYGWGHWGFVKGHMEEGESEEETLWREVMEETGIGREHLKKIDGFREKISYFYTKEGKRIYKEVVYFLVESDTMKVRLSFEHTAHEWLEYEEALKRITFDNDRNVLRKANEFLKSMDNSRNVP